MLHGIRRWAAVAFVFALIAGSGAARAADDYPNHAVRWLVGYPPGGSTDIVSRIMAQYLSEHLHQQFAVENKPGAGNNLATEVAAKSAPDGYTVLLVNPANAINASLYKNLPFDFLRDMAPIAGFMRVPNLMEVNPAVPAKTVAEFIAYAKANPGKVSWASPGVGTVPHLAGELFKHMAGIEMTHVPYRGVTEGLMSDFISGRLDLMFNTTGSLLQPVRAKQVRGLAVTSAKRFADEPELPTVAESGVPGYDVSSWYGVYAPAKTPPEIISKINADMVTILGDPAVKEKYKMLGVLAQGSTPAELAYRNKADAALWAPIIKEANIKVE
jgi:tripartite-type tricarboxylate transporter receptor subunit TctC